MPKVKKLHFRLNTRSGRPSYFVVKRLPHSRPFTPGDEVVITRKPGGVWRGTVFDLIAANDRLAVVQVFWTGDGKKADAAKPGPEKSDDKIIVTIEGTPSEELPAPEPEAEDD